MNDEASSSSEMPRGIKLTNTNMTAEPAKTRRSSLISSFRDRLRSRLSSSNVGNRLKSLVKWKEAKVRASKQPTTATAATTSASSFQDLSLAATTAATTAAVDSIVEGAISEAAGNRLTNETTASACRITEEEDNPGVPSRNLIESNLVSSTFDSGTSSFVTAHSSLPSHEGEDREVTSSNYVELSNSMATASGSLNVTETTDDEVNPISGQDSLGLPSAVIGVQLQAASSSLGAARILDVIPILFIQSGASGSLNLGNSRSTTTEESFTSNSTTGSSATEDSSNASMSSSASAVIEIVTPMEESTRRFERDYVRPYYDLNYRPSIRKHFRRLDDDPPIY